MATTGSPPHFVEDILTGKHTVALASEAHALNSTFSDVEVETALNALGAIINDLIVILQIDQP